jgi:predicted nucleic acid-binding protein
MKVLVDTSVWVAYLRGPDDVPSVDWLIEEGLLVTNDLILAELTPPLLVRGERTLVSLLRDVERLPLALDWGGIVQMQVTCLRNGINRIGIPDLIIAQHAIQNDLSLFSLDKHFALLRRHFPLNLH